MHNALRSVIAALCLLLIAAAGCTDTHVAPETIEETVHAIIDANREVETVTFDLALTGTVRTEDDCEVSEVLLTGTGAGVVDNTARRMHLSMTLRSTVSGQSAADLPLEYYLMNEWLYMGSCPSQEKPRWLKMRVPTDVWQGQAQQVQMLRSASEITYRGMESIDGVACHVVAIAPDDASTQEMLQQTYGQLAPLGHYDHRSMDTAEILGEVSVIQYVAADSHLFVRTDQNVFLEAVRDTAGLPNGCCDRTIYRLATTMVFGNYGEPVTIQMPQGSLAAIEIGPSR